MCRGRTIVRRFRVACSVQQGSALANKMVLGIAWPWARAREEEETHKTVSIFLGFFFVLNFCVGTGFLGIPYSFFYSGYPVVIPTFLFVAGITWINSNYLLEIMARAQALEYLDNSLASGETNGNDSSSEREMDEINVFTRAAAAAAPGHPRFEVTVRRKFEISELSEMFVSKYLKYIFLALLSADNFLAMWSFATVAASAWATNIPIHMGAAAQCSDTAFSSDLLPSGGCLYAYYFFLTVFGALVVTLSLFDLKEQAVVQVTMGILRFTAIAAIVIYCIVKLFEGGNRCIELTGSNSTTYSNSTAPTYSVLSFNWKGWVVAIPVFVYAYIFQSAIPSLTHPVKQKQYLQWLIVAVFGVTTLCYFSLGVVVPLWFNASIQETCTLNWASSTLSGNPVPLRVFSYLLVLFPSLDVISAFPLVNHVTVNNLYILITGQDTSRKPKYRFDWFLRISLRFVAAVLPILAAFGMANLINILKYAGLIGFVCYFFPTVLQLCSIYVCKKRFSRTGPMAVESREDDEVSSALGNKDQKSPLLAKDLDSKEKQSLYMTPYSIRFLSHPVCVWIVGGIGLTLFILAIISLFVYPSSLEC